jgi:hypothetical protein
MQASSQSVQVAWHFGKHTQVYVLTFRTTADVTEGMRIQCENANLVWEGRNDSTTSSQTYLDKNNFKDDFYAGRAVVVLGQQQAEGRLTAKGAWRPMS